MTFHPYQVDPNNAGLNPDILQRDIDTVRQLMRANGEGDKPLWATEIGWSMNTTEEARMRAPLSLPSAYLMSLAGTPTSFLDKVFWCDLAPAWQDYGSSLYLLDWGSTWSITPEPCSYAFRQMTQELLGKRLNGRVLSGDSATDANSRVYELEDTATHKKTWAGWRNYGTNGAAVSVRIPARTGLAGQNLARTGRAAGFCASAGRDQRLAVRCTW